MVQVRLTPDIAGKVKALATAERRSASQMATMLVEEALGWRELPPTEADPAQLQFGTALVGRDASVSVLESQSGDDDAVSQGSRPTSAA